LIESGGSSGARESEWTNRVFDVTIESLAVCGKDVRIERVGFGFTGAAIVSSAFAPTVSAAGRAGSGEAVTGEAGSWPCT
jgi:hypothetical protein